MKHLCSEHARTVSPAQSSGAFCSLWAPLALPSPSQTLHVPPATQSRLRSSLFPRVGPQALGEMCV